APGQISHMANIWSNDNRRPFLAMTAHWISEEPSTGTLKLKLVLLAFHRIHGENRWQRPYSIFWIMPRPQ
ncbi:hypothetical protein PAXINDRAFT_69656, partial [Paxillus involutus ATCC 200175]